MRCATIVGIDAYGDHLTATKKTDQKVTELVTANNKQLPPRLADTSIKRTFRPDMISRSNGAFHTMSITGNITQAAMIVFLSACQHSGRGSSTDETYLGLCPIGERDDRAPPSDQE